jgi:hypothetical protein
MNNTHYLAIEVAALAACSRIYVLKSIERGNLVAYRTGRGRTSPYVIPAEEAERFISEVRMRRTLREADKLNP